MRRPRLAAAAVVGGLAVLAVAAAERPAVQQEVTPERLAELTAIRPVPGKNGLYVIPGLDGGVTGGNVAVRVTNDGVILVDNKFPYSYEMITTEVRKMTSLPIRYVLDTHHHGDHSGSNADFMAVSEVISHKNARGNMIRNNQPGAPRVVFSDETSIFIGGVEVQAHHFGRGHTDGDAVIYFPDLRTIHTGDLFIWGQRSDGSTLSPFMDFGNGGSGLAWTGTLDGVLELDFDTVIPGHGPILGKDEVRIFRDRMQTLQDRMREAVEAGVSRDDVPGRIQTDDLDWPLSDVALQRFYDEVSESQ
ncbi:MAG: MBL fold metallo-hydrolase [Acidobacteria bacterium]|nr:MBL fold metallo-hydrolase [Acidobacteriota bacterium]